MSAVDIEGIHKAFGDREVLSDLSLRVPAGGVTAILGSSGSGKSTLLRCVAGLLRPNAGRIVIGGGVVVGPGCWLPPERRRVGLVPQEGALFPHLSVAENVGYGLKAGRRDPRVGELLELVGLPGTAHMRPHQLSGGMQQRVAVARALAPRPDVILLDEPFSALDAGLRDEVRSEVFEALRATTTTAILVTHDQQEAFAVADEVAVMIDGKVAQADTPAELYLNPASLRVAQFIGDTVLVPATMAGPGLADTALGRMPGDGGTTGSGVVVFRPEDLTVHSFGTPLTAGVVDTVRYHGHESLLTVLAAGLELKVRAPGRVPQRRGDPVEVRTIRPGRFFQT